MALVSVPTDTFKRMESDLLWVSKEMKNAIRKTLLKEMKVSAAIMKNNVSGVVLHTRTGELAKRVKASTFMKGNTLTGRAGSSYFIGRFWEDGFMLTMRDGKKKHMAPRHWWRQVAKSRDPAVMAAVQGTMDQMLREKGLSK
jgi:hypothetical protein